ncbi:LytR/AlgR family response regulator transcription factor [Kriegella aquimaris]|uniref:Two component transcriptional regulator, LytTR family n=1 Tax=Kriegella aquimaris TaxID=192904 RepID=A0A1G9KDS0_9FLAO|nr:LytTR family DNA-binding domain-containing protein [Kriegella aquimaris]SDL47958.1 two component transcriptional regulator, LytTR family [Kriegella aquimaris]
MNCIVIDDDETFRAIIEQLADNNSNVNLQGSFPSAIEAIKYLNFNSVDLIFLDIHMPDFNGFDFVRTLKNPPNIILTTGDKNFALEAFEYECIIDYFVKPVTQERFDKGLKKAMSLHKESVVTYKNPVPDESVNDLYINIDRRLIKVNIPSITIVEARGDYILLKTDTKNYTVHSTLKKIEDKLPKEVFLKVHRSFVINTKKIIDIQDNSVLIGKDIVPVSRSNRSELMRSLNRL